MSTPRFPRTKFVRALLRMETELASWAEHARKINLQQGVAVQQNGWDDRATALWVAGLDMHSLADDMAHLPGAAQRRYQRDSRSRAAQRRRANSEVPASV